MQLISSVCIWDSARHSAFTDLIRFQNSWICTFREADSHQCGQNGVIRLIQSVDGQNWRSLALIEEAGVDLRDPKLSITPKGELMLCCGGSVYEGHTLITRQSRVSFSKDGQLWGPLIPVLKPLDWLWRVTWHQGQAYGVSYGEKLQLFQSANGIDYTNITTWEIEGRASETTLRVNDRGQMIALVRRDGLNHALIGSSEPPFTTWHWKQTSHHFGGPDFMILPDQSMWAAGRLVQVNPYGFFEKTAVARMTLNDLYPQLLLPSGIDCSYPALVYHGGLLWMSYYSSHEGKSAIYLAKIRQ